MAPDDPNDAIRKLIIDHHDHIHAYLAGADPESPDVTISRQLLADLTDPTPCRHDHHGYCQEHNHLDDTPCPHLLAQRILDQ